MGLPGWVEASEYFTPSEAEYLGFEAELAATLQAATTDDHALQLLDPWTAKSEGAHDFAVLEIGKILERLPEYRRQVFGVVVHGQRMLYVNFLPGADWNKFGDSFEDWRKRSIATSDGGFWFWAIMFDPKSRSYYQLDLHGYA